MRTGDGFDSSQNIWKRKYFTNDECECNDWLYLCNSAEHQTFIVFPMGSYYNNCPIGNVDSFNCLGLQLSLHLLILPSVDLS